MIVVISTGIEAPTKHVCLASVARQRGVDFRHEYIESAPDVTRIENWARVIAPLPPETVCAIVDGDDWLSDRDVLAKVQAAHDAGAWITWGSYMTADGDRGIAADYGDDEDPRKTTWRATHLKTFRAGLFQRLGVYEVCADEARAADGKYIEHAPDLAIMLPMLELAGRDRWRFLPEILYVYNLANAWETRNPGRGPELEAERVIRAKRPRGRMESL